MTTASERRHRLARLEQLAELKATAERQRLGQRLKDETRLTRDVAALTARRAAAEKRLGEEPWPDVAQVSATLAWLRASQEELRRLNIQLAALRARSETARLASSRATARHAVLEELLLREKMAAGRARR
ncbi:MAG: hypothetical protein AAGG09_14415 [Pseudomonadota bacterium]